MTNYFCRYPCVDVDFKLFKCFSGRVKNVMRVSEVEFEKSTEKPADIQEELHKKYGVSNYNQQKPINVFWCYVVYTHCNIVIFPKWYPVINERFKKNIYINQLFLFVPFIIHYTFPSTHILKLNKKWY